MKQSLEIHQKIQSRKIKKPPLEGYLLTPLSPILRHPTEEGEKPTCQGPGVSHSPWLSAPTDGFLIAESARLHPKSITNFLKKKNLQDSKIDFIQRKVQNNYQLKA